MSGSVHQAASGLAVGLLTGEELYGGVLCWGQRATTSRLDPAQLLDVNGAIGRYGAENPTSFSQMVDPPVVLPILVSKQHALQALEVIIPARS
jgi:hypothetical protein